MYEWARERWAEGSRIDLAAHLPRIKAYIRIERADEEAREAAIEKTCRVTIDVDEEGEEEEEVVKPARRR